MYMHAHSNTRIVHIRVRTSTHQHMIQHTLRRNHAGMAPVVIGEGELPAGAEYAAYLPGTHLMMVIIFACVSMIASRCGGGCGSCCRIGTWIFLSWAFVCSLVSPLLYVVETREDEVHFITSKDGWRINLARYRAAGSIVGERKQSITVCDVCVGICDCVCV